jgi:hypothetical protein
MHVRAEFPADSQPPQLVQPRQRPLNPPPVLAQRRSEKVASTGEFGADAPLPEGSAVQVGVVAAVPDHRVRPPARASRPAPHRWDRVHQSQELGDVVDVGGGQHTRERQPVRVGDQVMLGAEPAAIDRARSSLVAPPMARTWLESTSARDQSSWSASRSSPSRIWWSDPRPRPRSSPATSASRSYPSRSRARGAGAPSRSR